MNETTRRRLLLGGLFLAACGGARAGPPDGGPRPPAIPVVAATVERRDVPIYLDGLGTAVAYKTVTVHTLVDGQLVEVHFREGQAVRRGDELALVDPRPFVAQLHQAQAALARDRALLKNSQLNLKRIANLRKRHLVAQENVDDQAALVGQYLGATQVDRSQIETAKLNLTYAHITATIDGVTGVRLVDPGNLVHPADATGIVVLTQLDPIAVLFTLPQDDLPAVLRELAKGPLTVELYNRDGNDLLGIGRVEVVDNQINQTTATLRLKAIAQNPERRLWPNQFVKAHLHLLTRYDALVVPQTVVQRGPQETFAYVIGPDDTVAVRTVEPELTQGEFTLIKRGLEPGERVVVEGQNQLSPGARVAVRPAEPSRPPEPRGGAEP